MQTVLKALYGAATAALSATSAAYVQGGGHIGWAGGIIIAGAALTTFGAVWGVPNAPGRGAGGDG